MFKDASSWPATSDPRPLEPIRTLLAAFDRFPIVALIEPCALEEEHNFIASLIRSPDFASWVNDVVVDFGVRLPEGARPIAVEQ